MIFVEVVLLRTLKVNDKVLIGHYWTVVRYRVVFSERGADVLGTVSLLEHSSSC